MFYRLRRQLARSQFDRQCAGVLRTPPLAIRPAPLTFVSMVSHADMTMYLAAIKSLYRRVRRGRVLVIDDGSLTAQDHGILSEHLGRPVIVPLHALQTGPCPRGGTWERLLLILHLSEEHYVIQADSDTLATAPLDEVVDCIEANRAFTLGTRMGQGIETLEAAAARVARLPDDHIQVAAERVFARLPDSAGTRYVRGSSGFAGFARRGFPRARLEAFSVAMQAHLGPRWSEWGTEQVSSNYVVANSPGAVVLPYPRYACFDLEMDPAASAFLHFIGTNRYDGGVYAGLVNRTMADAA